MLPIRSYGRWNQVWNIDCHLRYSSANKALKQFSPSDICEVGAGNAGLGFLLKKPILAIDIAFNKSILDSANPYIIPISGTGTHLPLRADAMAATLSIDSIEHVPRALRYQAIFELLRVTRRVVVISMPLAEDALESDTQLFEYYRRHYHSKTFWLAEHLDLGLPTEQEIDKCIEVAAQALGKRISVTKQRHMPLLIHNLNHRVLMLGRYRFSRILSWLLWCAYPLLRLIPQRGYYRRFFVVDIA